MLLPTLLQGLSVLEHDYCHEEQGLLKAFTWLTSDSEFQAFAARNIQARQSAVLPPCPDQPTLNDLALMMVSCRQAAIQAVEECKSLKVIVRESLTRSSGRVSEPFAHSHAVSTLTGSGSGETGDRNLHASVQATLIPAPAATLQCETPLEAILKYENALKFVPTLETMNGRAKSGAQTCGVGCAEIVKWYFGKRPNGILGSAPC